MSYQANKVKNSRLITLLSSLNKDEFKELKDFVYSPFHNKNTKVMQLFDVLEKYYPEFASPRLSRETLHTKIFKGQSFNDLDIRRTMSQLYQVAENYVGWREMTRKTTDLKLAQMRTLRNRGLQKHFEKSSREAGAILEKEKRDLNYYYNLYNIEQERENFKEQFGGRRSETRLQEVSDSLDIFFMANKLKQSCTVFSYEQVFKHRYDIQLTQEVLDLLNKKNINTPLVNLYRFGLLTMIEPDNETHYLQLKQLLKSTPNLDPKEERNIHVLGQNYCIRNVNKGKTEYFNELFELYKLGLEKEVIQSDLSQFPPAFKNIVSTGLKVKEYQWVENFIYQYANLIEEDNQADYKNFNLARLCFDQQRFKEARQFLQGVEFKDLFVTLNARVLLIKIYYELDQLDLLEHQLKSFDHYIARQKNLSYHATIFKNVVRYISRMVKLDYNKQKDVNKLIEKIKSEKALTERDWLLAKIAG